MRAAIDELTRWQAQQQARLERCRPVQIHGRIAGVNGILLHSRMPLARIGDLCQIQRTDDSQVMAEIVGFDRQHTLLAALGPLDGIAIGARVTPLFQPHGLLVSEQLLGTVLDGFGRALSGEGPEASCWLGDPAT